MAADIDIARAEPDDSERVYLATPWQLTWWRFRKHKLAVAAGIVLLAFYLGALLAPFLATAPPTLGEAQRSLMPPQQVYWFDETGFNPHVLGMKWYSVLSPSSLS